jgi:hypothetical protein
LGFWLFNQGPMPERLAMLWAPPAALRNEIFLGVFVWCPLLAAGGLGAFGLRRDNEARHSLRLIGLLFWLAVLLAALGEHSLSAREYNAAATLPFWLSGLIGLGFFVEYHLWLMRGFFWKNLLRALFLAALAASLGNAWWEAARANVGPPPRATVRLWRAPAAVPPSLPEGARFGPLPASRRDAFFLNADRTLAWAVRAPVEFAATLRPGINHVALFLPLLAALALAPALARAGFRRWAAKRSPASAPSPLRRERVMPETHADEPPDEWFDAPRPEGSDESEVDAAPTGDADRPARSPRR